MQPLEHFAIVIPLFSTAALPSLLHPIALTLGI